MKNLSQTLVFLCHLQEAWVTVKISHYHGCLLRKTKKGSLKENSPCLKFGLHVIRQKEVAGDEPTAIIVTISMGSIRGLLFIVYLIWAEISAFIPMYVLNRNIFWYLSPQLMPAVLLICHTNDFYLLNVLTKCPPPIIKPWWFMFYSCPPSTQTKVCFCFADHFKAIFRFDAHSFTCVIVFYVLFLSLFLG